MDRNGETPKMIKACAVMMMLATPLLASNAFAMGSSDSWSSEGTDLSAVTELVDTGMYDMAIDKIETMLEEDPENADLTITLPTASARWVTLTVPRKTMNAP